MDLFQDEKENKSRQKEGYSEKKNSDGTLTTMMSAGRCNAASMSQMNSCPLSDTSKPIS